MSFSNLEKGLIRNAEKLQVGKRKVEKERKWRQSDKEVEQEYINTNSKVKASCRKVLHALPPPLSPNELQRFSGFAAWQRATFPHCHIACNLKLIFLKKKKIPHRCFYAELVCKMNKLSSITSTILISCCHHMLQAN